MPDLAAFETTSVRMEAMLLLRFLAPSEDVERIMAAVCAVTPLAIGAKYDSNAYQTAGGVERYRPLEGAAAGPETAVRQRPGVVEINFQVPNDPALLERVVETIFQVHSYQEPTISLEHVLASRSKGLDDSKNPHRWWNTTGDWKRGLGAEA
ncbi:hypothetical protein [Dongia sedimenti]|uniref:Uncharacterized protein n=1 Tax=Dongia sedimenti TaxID=3064282 RepID=A0ABU0YWI6_9PROT|nr:hypothetical protein [Rhodospirillaceae bacterium R-7]